MARPLRRMQYEGATGVASQQKGELSKIQECMQSRTQEMMPPSRRRSNVPIVEDESRKLPSWPRRCCCGRTVLGSRIEITSN